MNTASIHAHPEICHNPRDIAALENDTGRKAIICRKGVKLVSLDAITPLDIARPRIPACGRVEAA